MAEQGARLTVVVEGEGLRQVPLASVGLRAVAAALAAAPPGSLRCVTGHVVGERGAAPGKAGLVYLALPK